MPHNEPLKLEVLESYMRSGEGHRVRNAFVSLSKRFHPPREFVTRWAQLAWRCGLPERGLAWLYPYVRPAESKKLDATASEFAEYAACLTKWGAINEALQTLQKIDARELASVDLYRSLACIAQWDYRESIVHLQSYLKRDLELYSRVVAEVNLLSALVFERRNDEARAQFESSISTCEKNDFKLAGARLYELFAELCLSAKDFGGASEALDRAEALLADKQSIDSFFIRKYRAAVLAFSRPTDPAAQDAIKKVEAEARVRRHWETIRDVDRIRALAFVDEKRLNDVYFGTPYSSYKAHLEKEKPSSIEVQGCYDWKLGKGEARESLDLSQALRSSSSEPFFKLGMTHHRLFTALCADFYRPLRNATLFSEVFPEERYIPGQSPERVRKAIFRLRNELKRKKLPLVILEEEGTYRLDARVPITITILKASTPLVSRRESMEERLVEALGNSPSINAATVAKVLQLNSRASQRLLKSALENGRLEPLPGRGTFRVKKTS